ncbi:putative glycosyltransferase fused to TPR-repeat domain [Candidatus Kuenenia stuttgartiensis]|jgi:glycosyltransferase involved in cell wall biosynthesis|uniref:Putative glycosyltransferase fused to TPR-repeat domain n=2 Tax=Candidatus Kuenenia TaxID=380738 RepID=A0A6G7GW61_KUEST|nr:glycosyltransferase family 2 protein [Candidatus Kuenenia stuttgartiensis]MCF6152840.1 glycosyltransferase [Candidatus Kuenenia stuttgartiensis]QII13447.1 putative glycosyltransferase fused to TPR-repeat domain [Candidatus Kuenenia stuttgartiensis]
MDQSERLIHPGVRQRRYVHIMVKLSACLIVKNESGILPRCLESIQSFADEIIIVDTGSTDNTVEIALRYKAKVHHFQWRNDFSAARNESLQHANGDWILYIDADEIIDKANALKIRSLINSKDIMALTVRQCIPQQCDNIATSFYSEYCRVFRRHPEIRFEGTIHEQILPSIKRLGGKILRTDIIIHHWAYAFSKEKKRQRAERNLNYLLKEFEKNPDDSFTLFNLGMTYQELGNNDSAIQVYLRMLEKPTDIKNELTGQSHINLSKIYLENDNTTKAVYHAQQALLLDTNNPLSAYMLATIAVTKKQFQKAIEHLETAIKISEGETGIAPNVELNMAQIYLELGSCRYSLHDFVGAENDFLRSLAYDASATNPYILIGNSRLIRGDKRGAKDMFEQALTINPQLTEAKSGLTLCSNEKSALANE